METVTEITPVPSNEGVSKADGRNYKTIGRIYGLSLSSDKKQVTEEQIIHRIETQKSYIENYFKKIEQDITILERKIFSQRESISKHIDDMKNKLDELYHNFNLNGEIIRTSNNAQKESIVSRAGDMFIDEHTQMFRTLNDFMNQISRIISAFENESKHKTYLGELVELAKLTNECEKNLTDLHQGYAEGEAVKIALTKKN